MAEGGTSTNTMVQRMREVKMPLLSQNCLIFEDFSLLHIFMMNYSWFFALWRNIYLPSVLMSTVMSKKHRLEDSSLVVPVTKMCILQILAATAAECAKVRQVVGKVVNIVISKTFISLRIVLQNVTGESGIENFTRFLVKPILKKREVQRNSIMFMFGLTTMFFVEKTIKWDHSWLVELVTFLK